MYTRRELHHGVMDVELVLISVVQGVALTTLATVAAPMLHSHQLMTYAFVATGLLFVLAFWSVALVHAISFITWPMDLVHYFFYFGVALAECLMFTQMERPRDWFGYSLACFALVWNDLSSRHSFIPCGRPQGRPLGSVLLRGGSRRRPGASTTSHSSIRGLRRRPGPSRMTVFRREGTLSEIADSGDTTALPHSAIAAFGSCRPSS